MKFTIYLIISPALTLLLRTLTRTLGGDLVLRARVVPGIGTSVGSEEGLRVA